MKTKQDYYMSSFAIETLCLIFFIASCTELEKMTPPCNYIHNELQTCAFPMAPANLDGDLDNDTVWQDNRIHWEKVHSYMGHPAEMDDTDASFEFACVADQENMYFAFRAQDNDLQIGTEKNDCDDIYDDDSIEITIDQCSGGCMDHYDGHGAHLLVDVENLIPNQTILRCEEYRSDEPVEILNLRNEDTDVESFVKRIVGVGWNAEIKVPLKPTLNTSHWWNIVPTPGLTVGFQTAYNDDDSDSYYDDGSNYYNDDRDQQLLWGKKDWIPDEAQSWRNPQYLGKLMFCPIVEMGSDVDDSADVN